MQRFILLQCGSGPAEGKLTVDGGGEQGKRQLASGDRLLSVGVAHAVNEVIESKAAITSRNLRDAVEREKIELGCTPQQLHNLVKQLRQGEWNTN